MKTPISLKKPVSSFAGLPVPSPRACLRLLLLTGILVFTACKQKSPEPEPNAATRIAGVYVVNFLSFNGQGVTLPQNGVGASLELVKVNEKTVRASLTVTTDGDKETTDLEQITANRQDDGTIVLTDQARQVGTVKDNQLRIAADEGSDSFEIRATRQ